MKRAFPVIIALLGALGAAIQAAMLFSSGKAICLNDGCRVIEGLTRVSPLYINLAGCGFFLAAAALGWRAPESNSARRLLGRLLLAGIAAEGVLVAYQVLFAKAFCFWCLAVFALVALLNLLAGARQAAAAVAVFAASLAAFSVLSFGVVPPAAGGPALDGGTYGVRRAADPAKEVYLVFSSTCPHCAEVLRTVELSDSCNFHFNPIDRIASLDLPGVEPSASYDPGVNRNLLALLGIEEVPVLLAPGPEGTSIFRGEKRILAYIRARCVREAPVLTVDPARLFGDGSLDLLRDESDDGCNVTVECPPGEEQTP